MALTEIDRARDTLQAAARSGELHDFCDRHGVRLIVVPPPVGDGPLALAISWVPGHGNGSAELAEELQAWLGLGSIDLLELDRAGPDAVTEALDATLPLYEREPGILVGIRELALRRPSGRRWPPGTAADVPLTG